MTIYFRYHEIDPSSRWGASVGHLSIVYASARILANACDRCILSPQSVINSGAGAQVGGGVIVAGVKVGTRGVVAGEVVEDDVPDETAWMWGRVAVQL